jgi:hypothetical protein
LITSFNQLHGYQAIRSTYHTTLQATPCQLVFGRDMIHKIAFRANWNQVQKRKQDIINKSNQKENKNNSQIPYEYKVRDQVLLETPGILRKLSTPRTGPYPVTNVYENGTIRIQKGIKNNSQIPYEYKVRDQVLLETPGIRRKLSTPRTGPYPVTNVYKSGTIRIQNIKKELYQKE